MIFITGVHGAGKTTIAQHLQGWGFLHIETGNIVRKKYQEESHGVEFYTWASTQHQRFNRFIADAVITAISTAEQSQGNFQDILITGNRQISGIDYLLHNIPSLNRKPNLIIFIEANEQILFKRYVERPERRIGIEGMTFKKFKEEVLGFDIKMGLEEIRNRSNLIVRNEGKIEYCVDRVKKFLELNGYVFSK